MRNLLLFAFTIMMMAATAQTKKDATKPDPTGQDRYDLVLGTKAPLSIFTSPAYDYSSDFFDGFGKATARELGIEGKYAWDEFGKTAKLIIVDGDAVVWYENGAQWTECYLEKCIKDGKPYFNRLQIINKKIVQTVATAGKDGAPGKNGINCWDLNMNGKDDPEEDVNHDGWFNVNDCQGIKGDKGDKGDTGPQGLPGTSTTQTIYTTTSAPYGSNLYTNTGCGTCYGRQLQSFQNECLTCGNGIGSYGGGGNTIVFSPTVIVDKSNSNNGNTFTNSNTNNTWLNIGSTKPIPTPTNPRGTILTTSTTKVCGRGEFLFNGKCLASGNGNGNQPGNGNGSGNGNGNEPGNGNGSGNGNGNEPGNPYKGNTNNSRYTTVKNNTASNQSYAASNTSNNRYGSVKQNQVQTQPTKSTNYYGNSTKSAQAVNSSNVPVKNTYHYKTPNLEQKGYYFSSNNKPAALKTAAPAKNFSKGGGSSSFNSGSTYRFTKTK